MLLFLPEGVLSITAHEKETFNLKVRALSKDVISRYFDSDVYYDSTKDLPYHTTIMRPQLQEIMFSLLEQLDYTHLKEACNGQHYGTLLKQVHQSIQFYPDHEIVTKPVPEEPQFVVPEAAEIFAGMVLQDAGNKPEKPVWMSFYRS